MRGLLLGLIVLGVVAAAAAPTSAQDLGCGLGGGAYGLGFYNYGDGQGINNPRLPYYALFPPVYYSYPVPRTYGYSPFAYPPGTMTPELALPTAPVTYHNPFVPKNAKPDKSAAAPRTYYNPFVRAEAKDVIVAGLDR